MVKRAFASSSGVLIALGESLHRPRLSRIRGSRGISSRGHPRSLNQTIHVFGPVPKGPCAQPDWMQQPAKLKATKRVVGCSTKGEPLPNFGGRKEVLDFCWCHKVPPTWAPLHFLRYPGSKVSHTFNLRGLERRSEFLPNYLPQGVPRRHLLVVRFLPFFEPLKRDSVDRVVQLSAISRL